jgi:hypothetical protein
VQETQKLKALLCQLITTLCLFHQIHLSCEEKDKGK